MRTKGPRTAMIGRQSELKVLRDALSDADRGLSRCVVLGGEAGMGKTRLLSEFRAEIDADALVLSADCVDLGPLGVPFGPVRSLVRQLISAVGVDAVLAAAGPGRAAVMALLPELTNDENQDEGAEPLPETLVTLLATFSADRTITVVVDDAQWADAATLSLLGYLLRTVVDERLLVVITYRVEDTFRGHPLRQLLAELDRARVLTRLELRGLDEFEVADLVGRLQGSEPDGDTVDRITRRSGGVPFFVEELVGLGSARIPDTFRDVLLARYERLDGETRALLRVVAVGGTHVDAQVLEAVTGHVGLDELVRAASDETLLIADDSGYTFRHALVREAIYDELLPGERRRVHEQFATVLTERAAPASETSFHWMAAHDLPRALIATGTAFDEAVASRAYASAVQLGERALELWDSVPEPELGSGRTKSTLLGDVTTAARNAGDRKRSLALVAQAIEATPTSDTLAQVKLLELKAELSCDEGISGAEDIYLEALALIGDDGSDLELTARLQSALATRYELTGRIDLARAMFEKALVAARRANDPYSVTRILLGLGWLEALDGNLVSMRTLTREALDAAGEGTALLLYGTNASDAFVLLGEFPAALEAAERPLERARELGLERRWGGILSNSVDALIGLGRWDEAIERGRRVLIIQPDGCSIATQHRRRIMIANWKDDTTAASAIAREHGQLIDTFGARGDLQDVLPTATALGELSLFQGRLDEAWRHVSIVWELDHHGSTGYDLPLLGLAARIVGEMRRAGLPEPEGAREHIDAVFEQASPWPTVSRWRALVAAELSANDTRAWRIAAEALSDESMPAHLRAYSLLRLGQAQLADGDRVSASETLRLAVELAQTIGVDWVTNRASGLIASAALGDRVQDSGDQLTARERQVLDLIAEGLSNKDIGQRLYISTKTASIHVSAILRKLGVTTRTQAALLAEHAMSTGAKSELANE